MYFLGSQRNPKLHREFFCHSFMFTGGVVMFEFTVRQRLAALVLLVFLGIGGILIFISRNSRYADTYSETVKPAPIIVHVCGAVQKPGIVSIPPATRKFEAVKLAGGTLTDADLSQVNLAEFALDGEQIYIPKKGEEVRAAKTRKTANQGKSKPKTAVTKVNIQWPLDLNSTTASELEKVPGIGPGLAAKILHYRTETGRFQNYEELQKIAGIGKAKLEKFRSYLTVR
jgi:competence protein ComEA